MYPTKKLSEIAKTTSGGTPSRDKKEFWGGVIPWLKSGELSDNLNITQSEEFITEEGLNNSSTKIFKKGTLLIAMYGATAGKLGILGIDATTNQAVCSIQNNYNQFVEKYIYYFLFSIRERIIKDSFGGAQPNISKGYLDKLEIPLPPLSIQSRIVAKLDEAFGNIDKQIELLKVNIEDVENMKKSVLEESFQGNEYFSKKLSEIVTFFSGGTPSKSNKSFWIGSIPWISPKDMKRVKINSATDHVSEEAVSSSATRLLPVNSLLCVTRSGILVHSFPVAINIVPVTFNQDIRAIVPGKTIDCEYLYYVLKGKEREIISKGIKKGPTVHSIISGYLDNLLIPLPPLPRQQEIVAHLDAVFDKTRILRSEYESQIQDLEIMKQSLLEEAFAGRLVQENEA